MLNMTKISKNELDDWTLSLHLIFFLGLPCITSQRAELLIHQRAGSSRLTLQDFWLDFAVADRFPHSATKPPDHDQIGARCSRQSSLSMSISAT